VGVDSQSKSKGTAKPPMPKPTMQRMTRRKAKLGEMALRMENMSITKHEAK
jgi:hypothetical protein